VKAVLVFLAVAPLFGQGFEGLRCGTPDRETRLAMFGVPELVPADCSAFSTNPTPDYDPTVIYEIQVVVHIIMNNAGTQGVISNALVDTQIQIINEDFQAIMGSLGENGTNVQFRFVLASEDPDGNPTDGITRSMNTTWFNDGGAYWNTLAWDPTRYINIYTNTASGNLGYVPFLPADGAGVGTAADRVVILWSSFGLGAPIGPPFDLGRTTTHELGHYFGLEHVFNGGCGIATMPGCYTTGDLICDTNSDSNSHFGCTPSSSCGTPDPLDNYMEYTDDICMEKFTVEQTRRMRCSIDAYRSGLISVVGGCATSDLAIDGGNDAEICSGSGIVLNTNTTGGTGGFTYSWMPATGLDDPTAANPTASPGTTTTYTVTVTDSLGCESEDAVTVFVYPNDLLDYITLWANPGAYNETYDRDEDGTISLLDFLSIMNLCLPE
jgi:hypothetical protein